MSLTTRPHPLHPPPPLPLHRPIPESPTAPSQFQPLPSPSTLLTPWVCLRLAFGIRPGLSFLVALAVLSVDRRYDRVRGRGIAFIFPDGQGGADYLHVLRDSHWGVGETKNGVGRGRRRDGDISPRCYRGRACSCVVILMACDQRYLDCSNRHCEQ